jgi:hypothetical protein
MARTCAVCGDEACLVHCVFCGADCNLPEPDHADDCPSVTGLYPVIERDLMCPGCGETYEGMLCSECEEPFKIGDHYTHRQIGEGNPIPDGPPCPIYEPICLGCAATEAVA